MTGAGNRTSDPPWRGAEALGQDRAGDQCKARQRMREGTGNRLGEKGEEEQKNSKGGVMPRPKSRKEKKKGLPGSSPTRCRILPELLETESPRGLGEGGFEGGGPRWIDSTYKDQVAGSLVPDLFPCIYFNQIRSFPIPVPGFVFC